MQFSYGFHIKAANPNFQGSHDFFTGFSHAGKYHLARLTTCGQDAFQFSLRHNIKARTQLRHHIQYGNIGIGFYRITNQMWMRSQCTIKRVPMAFQGCAGINVKWCTELFGKLLYGAFFGKQATILKLEEIHKISCNKSV